MSERRAWYNGRRITEVDQPVDDQIDLSLRVGDLGGRVGRVPGSWVQYERSTSNGEAAGLTK